MAEDEELEEGKKRDTAAGLYFSLGVLILVLIAAIVFAKWQSRGLDYTVQFKDAQGIGKGDKVTLSGMPIGEVRGVELKKDNEVLVQVRIQEAHADKIKQNSTALIANPTFPNVSGQKVVEVYNPAAQEAKPLKEGATVQGQDSLVSLKTWQIRQSLGRMGRDASDSARAVAEKLSEMAEELKDIPESPEVKAALEKMSELAEALGEKGKEGLAAFSREWDAMVEACGPLLAQWREKGAVKFREALDAAQAMWKDKGRDLRQRLAERLAPPAEKSPQGTPAAPGAAP